MTFEDFLNLVARTPGIGRRPNPEQRACIGSDPATPTMIVAGPGSGKTTVLVLRALRHILVDQVPPEQILITTFTVKAAREIRSRLIEWGEALFEAAAAGDLSEDDRAFLAHVDINRIVTGSLSADRQADSVTPKAEATKLMAEVMDRLAPELTLLGDFHSHPYKDRDAVNRNKGFEFSSADFTAFLHDDELWTRNADGPVMMVVTICRLSRVHNTDGKPIRKNIWQFDLGEFRFWINVCIGFLGEDGGRQHTGNKWSSVWLDLNSRFFNLSGDRVGS